MRRADAEKLLSRYLDTRDQARTSLEVAALRGATAEQKEAAVQTVYESQQVRKQVLDAMAGRKPR